jgi:signal recognition particle receptor subunit beta
MVFFNYTTMQMAAKIVYYGPGLGGKTTNLQHIHNRTAPSSRGEMVSLETETDRTLFFDLLPLDVGIIGGMKVRLQVYTVPGQVFYNATRKLVLKGVDGIVFVADSQLEALDANVESRRNLDENLRELGLDLSQVPFVVQYNKRDIRNIHTIETLDAALNPTGAPYFEAAALHGIGVFETLKGISRLALASLRRQLAAEPAAGLEEAPPEGPEDVPASPDGPPEGSEELALEFAEEDTAKRRVRPVATRGHLDIQRQLEELRAMASAPARRMRPKTTAASGLERRLQQILVSDRDSRPEVKRKASLDVPASLLKGSTAIRLHVTFDGDDGEETVQDVVTVKLPGSQRIERLNLHLDLELRGKS